MVTITITLPPRLKILFKKRFIMLISRKDSFLYNFGRKNDQPRNANKHGYLASVPPTLKLLKIDIVGIFDRKITAG